MHTSDDGFRLGPPESEVFARFSAKERPHGDELTVFDVRLIGPGLDAHCEVESIAGDHGLRTEFALPEDETHIATELRLVDWLRELAEAEQPWVGEQGWRSLADELRLVATCDALGHVSLRVGIHQRPWLPTWSATVALQFSLGELARIAEELDTWFSQDPRSGS